MMSNILIFDRLHLWFVWLLQNGATRFRETLPVVELVVPVEPLEGIIHSSIVVVKQDLEIPIEISFVLFEQTY